MMKNPMKLVGICSTALILCCPPALAGHEEPFDEAYLFFELNHTDGDLGIHAKIDGEAWQQLHIERNASYRNFLDIYVRSSLRLQGLTEIFFESAEPTFDELDASKFFKRFPEGSYEVEGITLDGTELESTVSLTHLMPAPVTLTVNGEPAAADCDAEELPVVAAGDAVVIAWLPVTRSHPELGRVDEEIEVVNYEVEAEIDETPYAVHAVLPADSTSFVIPAEIIAVGMALGEDDDEGESEDDEEDEEDERIEIKFAVLVREASYNQTGVESCFEVE